MSGKFRLGMGTTAAVLLIVAGSGLSGTSGAATAPPIKDASAHPDVTSSSVTIGILTPVTGQVASSFGEPGVAAMEAAFKQANAQGGVNGRKIKWVVADNASDPTRELTTYRSLVSQGVFGIAQSDPFFPAIEAQAVTDGIPVASGLLGGVASLSPKDYNIFDAIGSPNLGYPGFTSYSKYLKAKGVTKLAIIGSSSPAASQNSSLSISSAAKAVGIPTVFRDFSQPLGGSNF